MAAKLIDARFSREDWIYERKLDGERVIAYCKSGKVTLYSRNTKKLNKICPEIVEILEDQPLGNFIVDGEVVAFEGYVTSFARLQNRVKISSVKEAGKSNVAVYYYIFDILHIDGYDFSKVPQLQRKRILKKALNWGKPIRYTAHRRKKGEKYYKEACKKGWEGVIAKDGSARYVHSRSSKWLKFKCVNGRELVIGGYTDPRGSRIGFGALLVGYYRNGKLKYAGKVGTGFDDELLERLSKRMKKISRRKSPFDDTVKEKNAHWVEPKLVGEFGFTEWTSGGKLRHRRFKGLRQDKDPKKVYWEKPGA